MATVVPEPIERRVRLSELLGRPVMAPDGQQLGKVADVVAGLAAGPDRYPLVRGGTMSLEGRTVFVPLDQISSVADEAVRLSTARVDLRPFERRPGEVLMKADLLGHRLIDVDAVRLIRAKDLQLTERDAHWLLTGVEVADPGLLTHLLRRNRGLACRDWAVFEPLIGHGDTAAHRIPFSRLRRLRPADIADLIEDANRQEGQEILDAVGQDKELEADVFEELEDKAQLEMLDDRTDAEVADVLGRMSPDDAADLLTRLPQPRRLPVLGLLPPVLQTKIRILLGYHPDTAGGLMTPEFLAVPTATRVHDALDRVRTGSSAFPEVLLTVYVTLGDRLVAAISLPKLLQADPSLSIDQVAEGDPVRVHPDADVTEVAVRMTDFNLVTLPVVDDDDRLIGVITVDDVLEVTVPDDWWDRVQDSVEPRRPRHTTHGSSL
jgi:CBS domain-containing protein/sporulation protein YlmC with PRC-barrel domain